MSDAHAEFERLSASRTEAAEAQRVLDEANLGLEAVADLERQQWVAYVEGGGRGPAPEPMSAARAQQASEVAEAHARHELAQRRADVLEPAIQAAYSRYLELAGQRAAHVAAVIREEADNLATQYEEAVRQVTRCELALGGLRDTANKANDGTTAGYIMDRARKGNQQSFGTPLLTKAEVAAIRERFTNLAEQLTADASASASISTEE